ncbi:MAG: dockerin type I domain-containing protein [Chloroflexota bacterium]|nr:dockerin type I domain-containing protein [Chloroflexota bacterium]
MPRKLTIIGVLAALVLGVVGLAQNANAAANDAQTFCLAGGHLAQGTCPAGAAAVNSEFCYDNAAGTGSPPFSSGGVVVCGAGTSSTDAPTSATPIKSWNIITLPIGNRLTLPITYTPAPFTFDTTVPTDQSVAVGDVTSQTDLLCNGTLDILARNGSTDGVQPDPGGGPGLVWPGNGWLPFGIFRTTLADPTYAYVDEVKPMPFPDITLDVSRFTRLWLGSTVGLDLPPNPSPAAGGVTDPKLQGTAFALLDTASSYVAGLHASVAILASSANPPTNAYLCLDSPQNSVSQNSTLIPGLTPGNYVRWTNLQSAADVVSGQVTRLMIARCVKVGGAAGTCDMSDADGDGVPAAVESVLGTNPNNVDTDADGSDDFQETFQFTNPNNVDTDGDGSWDKQDDLSGLNCANTTSLTCNTVNNGDLPATGAGSDDNCPVDANSSQLNSDSLFDFTNTPNVPPGTFARADATNPHQDKQGDACDADMDNDNMGNVVEAGFLHPNVAPGCLGSNNPAGSNCTTAGPPAGTLWCLPQGATAPTGGMTTVSTDPLNPDSDFDGGLDGRECEYGSDPTSAGVNSCSVYVPAQPIPPSLPNPPACNGLNRFPAAGSGSDPDGDLLYPDAAELTTRTSHINQQSPNAALLDIEAPCTTSWTVCPATPDGKVGPADNDSDGDRLNDGWEVKFYDTSPANADTDTDGCNDGTEASDVNGDHKVNATDQVSIGAHTTAGTLAPNPPYNTGGVRRPELATYDINKDGNINSTDQLVAASLFGNCDPGSPTGTGAQIALPIQVGAFP